MSGLQLDGKTKIRVEPGLFEWTKWVSGTCLPIWIPPAELATANLCVDTTYRYKKNKIKIYIYCFGLICCIANSHFLLSRPHFPVNKLTVSESYDTYISRSFQVTREILEECKNLGKF